MNDFIKKHPNLFALLIAFCSAILYILKTTSVFVTLTKEQIENVFSQYPGSLVQELIIEWIWLFVITFIAMYVGRVISNKGIFNKTEDFYKVKEDKKEKIYFILAVIALPIVIRIADFFFFPMEVEEFISPSTNILYLLYDGVLTTMYNGVVEELWFRLGLTSVLMYLIYKVFGKNKKPATRKIIIAGAILTSLFLFGIQLNTVVSAYQYSLNLFILIRTIILYLSMNFFYTHIFMKYGIKYAIICHIAFTIIFSILMPFAILAVSRWILL